MERRLGREPKDIGKDRIGYDVESKVPGDGRLALIEVQGRKLGATMVTVTWNEVLTALNKPDHYVLAVVEIDGDAYEPRYIRRYPFREPSFAEVSVSLDLKDLMALGRVPS